MCYEGGVRVARWCFCGDVVLSTERWCFLQERSSHYTTRVCMCVQKRKHSSKQEARQLPAAYVVKPLLLTYSEQVQA